MEIAQSGPRKFLSGNKYFLIALAVILIDQFIKLIVKFNLVMGDEIRVFGDWFKITYVENKGAAFGLTVAEILEKIGITISEQTSKLILSLFSIFAVIFIIYLLKKVARHRSALPFFLALILGGALGNIIDRVFYGVWFAGMNNYEPMLLHGRVVDMFHLDFGTLKIFGKSFEMWPVANLADIAISVGIVAILLFQRRFFRKHDQGIAQEEESESSKSEESGDIGPDAPVSETENRPDPEGENLTEKDEEKAEN